MHCIHRCNFLIQKLNTDHIKINRVNELQTQVRICVCKTVKIKIMQNTHLQKQKFITKVYFPQESEKIWDAGF